MPLTMVVESMVALCFLMRNSTKAVNPFMEAKWRLVIPFLDFELTKAFFESSASQTSILPFSEAK